MRFLHSQALPTLHLPPAQPAITASTHHQPTARSPAQRRDRPRMSYRQGLHALPGVGIPDEDLPTVVAAARRGQPRAIEAPGHTHDDPVMARQLEQQRASPGIPHKDVVIIAHANQPRAITTPGYVTDQACLPAIHPTL